MLRPERCNYTCAECEENGMLQLRAGAVPGKNIWGAWPLIIWEATTSRTTVSYCPVLSNLCNCRTVITLKIGGPGQDWGAVPP